jgi:hypothetical protein
MAIWSQRGAPDGPQQQVHDFLLGDWSADRFSDPKSTLSWISLSSTGISLRLPEIGFWSGVVSAVVHRADFEGDMTLSNTSATSKTIQLSWIFDPCQNSLRVSRDAASIVLFRSIPMLSPNVPTLYIISSLYTCVNSKSGIFLSKAAFDSGLPELAITNTTGNTMLVSPSKSCFDFSFVSDFHDKPLYSISAQLASFSNVNYFRATNSSLLLDNSFLFLITRADGLRAILVARVLELSPSGVAKVQVAALQYEWTTSSRRSQNDCLTTPYKDDSVPEVGVQT